MPGLATCRVRVPAPSGIPGTTSERVGATAESCQSAPVGSKSTLRRSSATAETRPLLARTETVSGPSTVTRVSSEIVRVLPPSITSPGLPGTTTRPLRP